MSKSSKPTGVELSDVIREEDDRSIALGDKLAMLTVASVLGLIANWVATGTTPVAGLPGMVILFVASAAGLMLAQYVPLKLPAIAWVSLLAIIITIPGVPGSDQVIEAVEKLNFLALATPALAYGGLALTQTEFQIARRSGWKIVVVAICVMFGTYIGSVIVADVTLRFFS